MRITKLYIQAKYFGQPFWGTLMSNLVCKLFGHKPPLCARHDLHTTDKEFCTLHFYSTDNVGRTSAYVVGDCPRCGEEYVVAHVHVPVTSDELPIDPDDGLT